MLGGHAEFARSHAEPPPENEAHARAAVVAQGEHQIVYAHLFVDVAESRAPLNGRRLCRGVHNHTWGKENQLVLVIDISHSHYCLF